MKKSRDTFTKNHKIFGTIEPSLRRMIDKMPESDLYTEKDWKLEKNSQSKKSKK